MYVRISQVEIKPNLGTRTSHMHTVWIDSQQSVCDSMKVFMTIHRCVYVCLCFFPLSLSDTYTDSPVPVTVDNNPFPTFMCQTGPSPNANMYQLLCGL